MRLTVNLDSDLYAVAKALARESDASVSAAVNQLIRRALERPLQATSRDGQTATPAVGQAGLPVVHCDQTFTSEEVYRIDLESS